MHSHCMPKNNDSTHYTTLVNYTTKHHLKYYMLPFEIPNKKGQHDIQPTRRPPKLFNTKEQIYEITI